MNIHELKTDKRVFQEVWDGLKTFEIRLNDRNFKTGDILLLKETQLTGAQMATGSPLLYTTRQLVTQVKHILHGPIYGLAEGWVIMSIMKPFGSEKS